MIHGMNTALKRALKRLYNPVDMMLLCVLWYVAYPLSLRNLEGMLSKAGIGNTNDAMIWLLAMRV